jgi:hypothetical protein
MTVPDTGNGSQRLRFEQAVSRRIFLRVAVVGFGCGWQVVGVGQQKTCKTPGG